jgi:hypothetical protein
MMGIARFAKLVHRSYEHRTSIAVSGIFASNTSPVLGLDKFIRNVWWVELEYGSIRHSEQQVPRKSDSG